MVLGWFPYMPCRIRPPCHLLLQCFPCIFHWLSIFTEPQISSPQIDLIYALIRGRSNRRSFSLEFKWLSKKLALVKILPIIALKRTVARYDVVSRFMLKLSGAFFFLLIFKLSLVKDSELPGIVFLNDCIQFCIFSLFLGSTDGGFKFIFDSYLFWCLLIET